MQTIKETTVLGTRKGNGLMLGGKPNGNVLKTIMSAAEIVVSAIVCVLALIVFYPFACLMVCLSCGELLFK
jgi:lipopolysaccharide/colanic/teichoic acid biosynthesis glycosyltransferase